ncbi:MAG: hypothetical protein GWN86_07100, partial [Desulfobacterales bacterium]|nr:hypothetical protein [Desulfobacterales bacterium]
MTEKGINSRLQEIADCASQIHEIAKKEGVDAICFCGDMFHTQKIAVSTYDTAARVIIKMAKDFRFFAIPGNHDEASRMQEMHALRAFSKAVKLLRPGKSVELGPHRIGGIPYYPSQKVLKKKLEKVKGENLDVLLIHTGFAGLKAGFEYIADFSEHLDPALINGTAPLVFSGHFHDPQKVMGRARTAVEKAETREFDIQSAKQSLLVVPGAPLQHTFSDEGSLRGCWTYDFKKSHLKFIPINGPPAFVRMGVDDLEKNQDLVKGNFVKVDIPSSIKSTKLDQVRQMLEKAKAFDFAFFDDEEEEETHERLE